MRCGHTDGQGDRQQPVTYTPNRGDTRETSQSKSRAERNTYLSFRKRLSYQPLHPRPSTCTLLSVQKTPAVQTVIRTPGRRSGPGPLRVRLLAQARVCTHTHPNGAGVRRGGPIWHELQTGHQVAGGPAVRAGPGTPGPALGKAPVSPVKPAVSVAE